MGTVTGENKHLSPIPFASVKFLSVSMSMRSLLAIIQPIFVYNFAVVYTKWEKRRRTK